MLMTRTYSIGKWLYLVLLVRPMAADTLKASDSQFKFAFLEDTLIVGTILHLSKVVEFERSFLNVFFLFS